MRSPRSRGVVLAAVTPLSSILGSGFLIIVPILELTLGSLALAGVALVCGLAWMVGTATRHNVAVAEPLRDAGRLDPATLRLERAADAVIVAAYVISVALYLRIMARYGVDLVTEDGVVAERALACAAVVVIVAVGAARGFAGLDLLERVALGGVLILTAILGATLFVHDAVALAGDGLRLPPVPDRGVGDILLVLGGIVITVQGFETVRYLGEEYDRETRVRASRVAQAAAAAIYAGLALVATPVMGIGTDAGADETLLDVTGRVAALLSIPLVATAVLSQFSAAVADTAAADGNLNQIVRAMRRPWSYVLSGAAAIVLVWLMPFFALVTLASRAFAAYYAIECVIALRTSTRPLPRAGFGALAVLMAAIAVFARPAG